MSKNYVRKTKPEYNDTITPMFESAGGHFYSLTVSEEIYEQVQKVKVGDKLTMRLLKDSSRKTEKSPHAYLERIDKAKVDEYAAEREASREEKVPSVNEDGPLPF